MKGFLLDTDSCVFLIRGRHSPAKKIVEIGLEHCFVSEISIAELRFGAERSKHRVREHSVVDLICSNFKVLPISQAIRTYAVEKARLWNAGQKIEDFDLLIGATALYHELILVTNNAKHFERLQSLKIENWT